MSFIDELKQAHEIEKKRIEEQEQQEAIAHKKALEEWTTKVHKAIRDYSMKNAKIGRTHAEGVVANGGCTWAIGREIEGIHYSEPIVGRRDSEGNFSWNDGGNCEAITTNGEFCDKIIAMVSDSLRKDGFVSVTLSRCPCYQKKWVWRKHFLSPDTSELIDTNNFLGYIIKYSVSW